MDFHQKYFFKQHNSFLHIHTTLLILLLASEIVQCQKLSPPSPNDLDFWTNERPKDMANIEELEVMCGRRHMEVSVQFDKPFNGIIYSKGAVDRYNCIHVKQQTGLSSYKFDIMYDQCGSKADLDGRFYENNIIIQYDKDLIEVWDEAKRLRCQWYDDYEKGVTKPPIRVSDVEVVDVNFDHVDNVNCWMEIQQGKGPWASPVTGSVPLGTTLSMVIGIIDKDNEFDMRVKSCEASDGKIRPIQLSDSDGCVLRPKMVSKFMKKKSTNPRATVVTYAFFHAFKFPDSTSVHIKCKVEICRHGCPGHCRQSRAAYVAEERVVSSDFNNFQVTPPPSPPSSKPYYAQIKRVSPPAYQNNPSIPKTPIGGIYYVPAPNSQQT